MFITSSLVSRLSNFGWEHRLGISTRGITEIPLADSYRSMTLPYDSIFTILRHIPLTPADVVVDIGCGKGRVVCCAALFPVRQVIGIEHFLPLSTLAQQNAARLRGRRAPITIQHAPAEQFDFHRGSVFYFYNSFGPAPLEAVLDRMKAALDERWRPIRFIYPCDEHASSLQACSWLEQYDHWEPLRSPSVPVPVSFWRSRKVS